MASFNQHQINLLVAIAQRKKMVIKNSLSSNALLENCGIGKPRAKNMITYESSDVKTAKEWCAKLGIEYKTYDPKTGTREERGLQQAKEKGSSITVYSEFVPVKVIGDVQVNGYPIFLPNCGFALLTPSEVESVAADSIVLVENLETFTNQMDKVRGVLPVNCLIVFRGSRQFGGNTEKTVLKWRKDNNLPVISFYDYDISGLIKQSEREWDHWLLPKTSCLKFKKLTGNFEDLENQRKELALKYRKAPNWLSAHIALFELLGGSFTQERLIGHGVELEVVSPHKEDIR
jgi:hypothetical protein